MLLFVALERENISITFSQEHLRFFFATYTKVANFSNFKTINKSDSAIISGTSFDVVIYSKTNKNNRSNADHHSGGNNPDDTSTVGNFITSGIATAVARQSTTMKKTKTKTILSNGSILWNT